MKLEEILNKLEKDLPNTIYSDEYFNLRFRTKKDAYLDGKNTEFLKIKNYLKGRELKEVK